MIGVAIPEHDLWNDKLPAVEADIERLGFDMIVGRNMLANARFVYEGPTGLWSLEIPFQPR